MFRRNKAAVQSQSPTPLPPSMGMPAGRASISSLASSNIHGGPPERINSVTSIETSGTMDTIKGKRRSGFLGLGRKKDKKDEDKAQIPTQQQQQLQHQQMNSFSVNGRQGLQQQPNGFIQPNGRVVTAQQTQQMQQMHPQQQQHLQQQQLHQQQLHQQQLQQQQMQQQQQSPIHPQQMQQQQMQQQQQPQLSPVPRNLQPQSPMQQQMSAPSPGGMSTMSNIAQFDPIVELISYQPHKTYVASPPELEMIFARTSAGQMPKTGQPGSPSNDWDAVWLQLSGTSLSMWSMKATRAAAARGAKVPPTYFSITESSLELLNPLPPPPHREHSHPHNHVFSLNTAGSNRLLFSCPNERELVRWSTGLRLASWERSRLEEIYTGHLLRGAGPQFDAPVMRGRYEGWVRVRVMGGTEWHRLWLVLSDPSTMDETNQPGRRTSIFSLGKHEEIQEPNTGVPMASFYNEPRTVKNKTSSLPVLTMTNVTQVYAVFPERVEVIHQSNLMKAVGRISGSLVTIEGGLRDSGWALVMPEAPSDDFGAQTPSSPVGVMLRWIVAFHDAFRLYGRPGQYIWDESDPRSLYFAYPQGELRGDLFLSIDEAIMANFRLNTPGIRAQFISLVQRRLRYIAKEQAAMADAPPSQGSRGPLVTAGQQAMDKPLPGQQQLDRQMPPQQQLDAPMPPPHEQQRQPSLPPHHQQQLQPPEGETSPADQSSPDYQFRLPPLAFGDTSPGEGARPLSPITESDALHSAVSARSEANRPPAQPESRTLAGHSGSEQRAHGLVNPVAVEQRPAQQRFNAVEQQRPPPQQRLNSVEQQRPAQQRINSVEQRPTEQRSNSLNTFGGDFGGDDERQSNRSAADPSESPASMAPSQISPAASKTSPTSMGTAAGVTAGAAAATAALVGVVAAHKSPDRQKNASREPVSRDEHPPVPPAPAMRSPGRNKEVKSFEEVVPPPHQAPQQPPQQPPQRQAVFNNNASSFIAPGSANSGHAHQVSNVPVGMPQGGGHQPRGSISGGVPRGSISGADVSSGSSTPTRDFTTALNTPMASNIAVNQQQQAQPPHPASPGKASAQHATRNVEPSSPPPSAYNQKVAMGAAAAAATAAAAAGVAHSHGHSQSQSSRSQSRQSSAELLQPTPKRRSFQEQTTGLRDEPAAMYLMNMVDSESVPPGGPMGGPMGVQSGGAPPSQKSLGSPNGQQSEQNPGPRPGLGAGSTVAAATAATATALGLSHHQQQQQQYNNNNNNIDTSSSIPTTTTTSVARRPSGARALNSTSTRSTSTASPNAQDTFEDQRQHGTNGRKNSFQSSPPAQQLASSTQSTQSQSQSQSLPQPQSARSAATDSNDLPPPSRKMTATDLGDAAAYMSYADQPSSPGRNKSQLPTSPAEVRSSFAPSKAAAERRARAEAQAAQQRSVMNVPGGGRRAKGKGPAGPAAWSGSESDESDDEEIPAHEPPPVAMHNSMYNNSSASVHRYSGQSHSPVPEINVERRGSRALPPVPNRLQTGGELSSPNDYYDSPVHAGMNQLSIHDPRMERPRSRSPPAPHRHLPEKPQHASSLPQPPAARQNVWNANFSVEHGMNERKGTFVQLDEPSVTLTKAFTPGGLLSAGLQDKEDRSAKRQEEVARETGSTLVDVASKPPPPATGLMGAVAAHERDRRNAGGIGATLTDRDRERRIGEERQRKIEELQRQQAEHMGQFGGGPGASMYGAQFGQFPGYGAMPPMGYNPYAAQQQAMYAAQMAYQQTLMAMSQAGSQMGDNPTQDGRHSPSGSIRAASPFGYGGYGMPPMGGMPGAPMSMYGFPQFMPGMPMGGSPGQMQAPLGGPGWQSPPGGMQGMQGGMRTSMMEPGSHTGSERDDRQAS